MKRLCIKNLVMLGRVEATKGKTYDFDKMGCFIDNSGDSHMMCEDIFQFFAPCETEKKIKKINLKKTIGISMFVVLFAAIGISISDATQTWWAGPAVLISAAFVVLWVIVACHLTEK
jgi:hypothetical protein